MPTPHKTPVKIREQELRTYLDTLPVKFRVHYENATLKLKGRKSAITAKCLDCMAYENAAKRIRECSNFKCPLWAFRPYQTNQTLARRNKVSQRNFSHHNEVSREDDQSR